MKIEIVNILFRGGKDRGCPYLLALNRDGRCLYGLEHILDGTADIPEYLHELEYAAQAFELRIVLFVSECGECALEQY